MPKTRVRLKSMIVNNLIQLNVAIILIFFAIQSEASHHSAHNRQHHHETKKNKADEYVLKQTFNGLRHHKHRPHRSHNLVHQYQYDYNGYQRGYDESKREIKRTASTTSPVSDLNTNQVSANDSSSVQRDYMAAVIGKDVQLDCRMKNLANDDDKVVFMNLT